MARFLATDGGWLLDKRKPVIVALLAVLSMLALACTSSEPEAVDHSGTTPTVVSESPTEVPATSPSSVSDSAAANRQPTGPPPKVDTSIASVALEDVLFDTFRGGFIRLSEATDQQIDSLRDRIRPIYEPKYDGPNGGDWLDNDDLVIGYESGNVAYAYPIKMLNLHEIVNDVIGGEPVVITYCPLCASGVVYSRQLDDRILLLGNTSALYESDMVMFDHGTGSYWHQVGGEAIVGELTGQRMTMLPSMTVTWSEWWELHPDTRVLSRNLGLLRTFTGNPYARDPFEGYDDRVDRRRFAFPVNEDKLDDRLEQGDRVVTLEVGETHRAYRVTGKSNTVVNDEINGRAVAVFFSESGPSASAFFRDVDGSTLTFSVDGDWITDGETGSVWDFSGRAVSGEMVGTRLDAVPSRASYWFAVVTSIPDVELYETN